ncbi:hypothetical protein [Mycolicibacterium fortuitum]|uniref:Uncharacterized protein n=2 Tax=Mycolicibacterium fortuitum TaxID=1766 RepID=A0AAE4VLI2_MYCFO|nr:hypothetical protein [Mycolicibacterium fortuitum]MCV7144234.1 hypothetical protein [Mycolicibacterium fortuitum]MDV7195769.1 hypothetical protein [Mycolicibacterium fortuitum]MDV7209463.1 hypothetical protein [Mycolicibacterium fortuitum]MDV7231314.1 hypothetical protein [Mycolicibacterium fortuitum]MDV7262838.1 hypothetical protein [Mycolicibacterium fortuitum]
MNTTTVDTTLFVFNAPSPEALQEMPTDYYNECRLAGAGSVEIERDDHSVVVVSATRFLPAGVDVAAVVTNGVLKVLCTTGDGQSVLMREFSDWTDYTVHRATR